jgi:hypothetical protein
MLVVLPVRIYPTWQVLYGGSGWPPDIPALRFVLSGHIWTWGLSAWARGQMGLAYNILDIYTNLNVQMGLST